MRAGWSALPFITKKGTQKTKVTVLIAARNEAANIGRTLSDILAQDFTEELPEVIVVADHSTDNPAAVVRSFAGQGSSDERRVGKALVRTCRTRWSRAQSKNKTKT